MLRIFFISILVLVVVLLFLEERAVQHPSELPVFLQQDTIAQNHDTKIDVSIKSMQIPGESDLEQLTKDYKNIWAHLNNLYATNNVEQGKEYYSENWFKQICTQYSGIEKPISTRKDLEHHLQIINWENDGLVCNVMDSAVLFKYAFENKPDCIRKASLAMALLFEGDHWRVDAIKVMEEK